MEPVYTKRLTRGSDRRLPAFLFGMVRSRGTSLLWAEARYEVRVAGAFLPDISRCSGSGL